MSFDTLSTAAVADVVRDGMVAAGCIPRAPPPRPRGTPAGPLRVVSEDGLVILVGHNGRQNELIAFKLAALNDLRLRTCWVLGAHATISSGGRPVSERTLRQAARPAARYSVARDQSKVLADIVARKRVRRIRAGNGITGMVNYTGARTLWISPEQPSAN